MKTDPSIASTGAVKRRCIADRSGCQRARPIPVGGDALEPERGSWRLDRRLWWCAIAFWFLLGCLSAAANPVATENVVASLVAERTQVAPGSSLELALVLRIRPGWHTYWRNPGDSGEPPRLTWILPDGVIAGPLRWPLPERIPVGPLANYGYSGQAIHPLTLEVPEDWPVGVPLPLRARADWLVCEEHCVPESAELALTLATAPSPGPADPEVAGILAVARAGLPEGRIDGAVLTATDRGLRLSIPWKAGQPSPAEVAWFAGAWGLIEHAAPQSWSWSGDRLEIALTPGSAAESAAPDGLLAVTGADGAVRSFEVAVRRADTALGTKTADQKAPIGLPLALAFALLGGLILNLMPCVFPILAMKAMSLVRGMAGEGADEGRERLRHGLAYTAGVLVFFGALAGLLLALRAGGAAIGWGFQLQYPPFVALMAYVFLTLGLSLSGAVTLGTRLMGLGGAQVGSGTAGAFGTGALAALVAAPCTAPFMGAALGYAVTLSWPLALAIMLTLGLGLALPFLLVSLLPGLARRMPKPGPWMESLKQFLAFPLYGAAAWLVWVLSVQTGPAGVAGVLAGMVLLAFALWLRELGGGRQPWVRRARLLVVVASLAGALALGLSTTRLAPVAANAVGDEAAGFATPYTADRLEAARAEGRPVFVNMTAAWCITCLVNERVALGTAAVTDAFRERNLLYLKGDWTNRDPAITDYLSGFGRNGVPLYVYYPSDGEPRVLPQILTPDLVLEALAGSP
ncbi:protein-disulfide reductase [Thiocystis violacea]|nr:protein-disulfide reductase [Thiocystis violacea]